MLRRWLPKFWSRVRHETSSALLNIALPETCAGCGRTGRWFCEDCERLIVPDDLPGCIRCGRRGYRSVSCNRCVDLYPEQLLQVRAGFSYSGPVRRAIHRFKYNGEFERGRDLGRRWSGKVEDIVSDHQFDLIVPIPLHARRYRSRGFNQAEILADELAGSLEIPVSNVLKRVRNTLPQVGLSAEDRLENLRSAFAGLEDDQADLDGQRVLLIDDVTTTGATFAAAATALASLGVTEVHGYALAREQ